MKLNIHRVHSVRIEEERQLGSTHLGSTHPFKIRKVIVTFSKNDCNGTEYTDTVEITLFGESANKSIEASIKYE